MYCPYCGNEIPEYASMCTHCGSSINLPTQLTEVDIRRMRRRYREQFGIPDKKNINESLSEELSAELIPAMYLSRLIAFLIDWAVVGGVLFFFLHSYRDDEISELIILVSPLWAFLYFALLTGFLGGRTIGKWITGIQVITEDKALPDLVIAVMRTFYSVFSFLFLFAGYIAPLFDSKSRGWHDRLAGTVVIYKR